MNYRHKDTLFFDIYNDKIVFTQAVMEEVTVEAIPNACCTFLHWTIKNVVVSTDPIYVFTVTESKFLTAHFMGDTYHITVSTNPPQGGAVSGGGIIPCAETITVCAFPNICYDFVCWTDGETGDIIATDACYEFPATKDLTLIANFTSKTYGITLLADPIEGGGILANGVLLPPDTITLYPPCGTSLELLAFPNDNYVFAGWFIDGVLSSTSPEITIIAAMSCTLTAKFEPEEYGITLLSNPEEGGYVIGSGIYAYGETVTVSAVSNEEYEFINWLENGIEIITDSEYTFTVTGSRTLTGNFETYDIVILSGTPGCGASGGGTYRPGIEVTAVAVVAKSGIYEFVNWTKDGVEVSTDAEYTFITPIGNMELVANFMETNVGIETAEIDGINIYPNPTDGQLIIENGQLRIENVEIFDIYGRNLSSHHLITSSPHHQIDISHLSAGTYFIRIQTENGVVMKRVVKQ